MDKFNVIQFKDRNESLVVMAESSVSEWVEFRPNIQLGLDLFKNIIQIKTNKLIKIVDLKNCPKNERNPLVLTLGEYGMSYLYLSGGLTYKGTKLGDKSVYKTLGVYIDISDKEEVMGIEFTSHPTILME